MKHNKMPRNAISYENTIMYKIVCKDLTIKDLYVGHTTCFRIRKSKHKDYCNKQKSNCKLYSVINQNGGWENWEMIEIEKFSCKDANEARARERHWFEALNATLNSQTPNRTKNDYYVDNKEHFQTLHKKYYETHKDKLLESACEKQECDVCSKLICKTNMVRHKKQMHQQQGKTL